MGRKQRDEIFCCVCEKSVRARLTTGREVYPRRADLRDLPFWKCDTCRNFVGCHHKTAERTRPLGCIPSPAIKRARREIHAVLDPIWKQKLMKRGDLYCEIASRLGVKEYHTAELRTVEDAREAYRHIREIARSFA